MKKLLITKDSQCVQPIRKLIEEQTHRTLVLWTQECAERVLTIFEDRCPADLRPRHAFDASVSWAKGEIKMPMAKKAAHAAHNAATIVVDSEPAACAAARAMGHVVGTIHVKTHAIGLVLYGITAFVYANPRENPEQIIFRELDWFYQKLLYWQENAEKSDRPWASFLTRDDVPT